MVPLESNHRATPEDETGTLPTELRTVEPESECRQKNEWEFFRSVSGLGLKWIRHADRIVTLVPIATVDRTALRWLRTEENPTAFALASGDARVAEIRWARSGGSLAVADTAEGSWSLKRGGFLNPHVTVRVSGEPSDLARITAHLSSHRIEVRGGRSFRFHRAGMLVPAWTIALEDGRELLHIEPVREGRKLVAGAVIATPLGADLREFLLLAVAGWYFIVLAWFEDEALVPLEGPDATSVSGGSRESAAR